MSIYRTTIRKLGANLAAALLPQDCYVCGSGGAGSLLCPGCKAGLPHLAGPHCPVCAVPTVGGTLCGACLKTPPHYDATVALYAYAFPVDRLVQGLKYRARLPLAGHFAQALAARRGPSVVDCILPLPLHPRRLAERGFNQAQEIARPLARRLGLPLLTFACERRLDTAPQASLPWEERRRNVRGAFECRLDLSGRSVAVVDDVMTTGATLNELARTLKKHGAARVINWVVARTLPD